MTTTRSRDGRNARGDRARHALLEATLRIIERDGIAGVSHRNVTREAGLPATSAAYHFDTITALLEQALLYADGQATSALKRCEQDSDSIGAFARWLVTDCIAQRARVIAEYELFLYAARVPSMQPSACRWLADLSALVTTWTSDREANRIICAYVDGYILQTLVTGETPESDRIEAAIHRLL